jgi:hypothetical protein
MHILRRERPMPCDPDGNQVEDQPDHD